MIQYKVKHKKWQGKFVFSPTYMVSLKIFNYTLALCFLIFTMLFLFSCAFRLVYLFIKTQSKKEKKKRKKDTYIFIYKMAEKKGPLAFKKKSSLLLYLLIKNLKFCLNFTQLTPTNLLCQI